MGRILLFIPFLFCLSCSSILKQRESYLAAYCMGDLPVAEEKVSYTIAKELPENNYRKSVDAVWLLLDRANIRFSVGDTKKAAEDYLLAIEAMDYYNQSLASELLGKVLFQDELGAYPGEDFEQILARIYFALALLDIGDTSNAYALLRSAEEWQQKKRSEYASSPITETYKIIDNPFGKYLFAVLLEKQGDSSNASILYQQANHLVSADPSLFPCTGKEDATVLVICHNGNAPHKISTITDASVASTMALEVFLNTTCVDQFSLSSLGGIPTPALAYSLHTRPMSVCATIDGLKKPLGLWYSVADTAEEQLKQKMPLIVARGVARYLIRRSAVNYAHEKDQSLGAVVDIAMLIANANTRVDTRSWSTLPEEIDLTRFDLAPGEHDLEIRVDPHVSNVRVYHYKIQLKPRQLCVIHVFTIDPEGTRIIIPKYCLLKGECL